ncbi:hypothetical protein V5O48_002289 [Marasmius crinis-equi]|uniref:FHA domain-containing protein n=1 Tax=Marasmius crinis-equi TaxID=585013 RepID=A0ABR3FW67_9AGAR
MWIVSGPFGAGVVTQDSKREINKVLKTNDNYTVGRKKDFPLWIDSKKVSNNHCTFLVGDFSEDDMANPDARPKIQVRNDREGNKTIGIAEKGEEDKNNVEYIVGGVTQDLREGQENTGSNGQKFAVLLHLLEVGRYRPKHVGNWARVHITPVLRSGVTHYITSAYSPTCQLAACLINGINIVKLEWLNELISVADSAFENSSFDLPGRSKYRPAFSSTLDSRHKRFEVWDPSDKRHHVFSSLRFLCAGEKNREIDPQLRFMIESGEGAIETFDVRCTARKTKWNRALSRGKAKEGKTLVVLGEEPGIISAAGEDGWKELVDESRSFGLVFKSTDDVIMAVLDNDISNLKGGISPDGVEDEDHRDSSPIPDVIPNSIPEEQTNPPQTADSQEPPPRRRPPPRRASSQVPEPEPPSAHAAEPAPESSSRRLPSRRATRQSSQPPEPPAAQEPTPQAEAAPRRRLPPRRVVADNSSDSPATLSTPQPSIPVVVDYTAPSRQRTVPRRAPKRALGSTDFGSRESSAAPEERVTKKYKALFEESDPAKDTTTSLAEMIEGTQLSQTMSSGKSKPVTQLGTVQEQEEVEMEISQTQTTGTGASSSQTGRKRKVIAISDDEEMAGVEEALAPSGSGSRMGSVAPPPSKRVAVEAVNSVEPVSQPTPTAKPPSSKATEKDTGGGAEPGKPDTDDAFLKAVASTKRGKKNEDNFDREFNNLKISKPELDQQTREEDQWAVLDQFGDDSGIRGNFMVIVQFDAPRSKRPAHVQEKNPEWDGVPNFKKFKKKNAATNPTSQTRRAKVDLVVSEQHAYGLGPDYWKEEDTSQARAFDQSESVIKTTQTQTQGTQSTGAAIVIKDSDSEEEEAPKPKTRKKASTVPKKTMKSQPLFLADSASEDDDGDGSEVPEATLDSAPPSNQQARNTRARKAKAQPIIVDDDSDDDAMFKGIRAKGRRR